MLIANADELGLSEKSLAALILIVLKIYKNDLFYSLLPKKQNTKLLFDALSLECGIFQEKEKLKQELSKFRRVMTETFSTAVGRFNSLFTHFQELKSPISNIH